MSVNSMGYQAYRKTQIQTADQGSLILMCYDGTVNFLKKAVMARKENDRKAWTHALGKAQSILWELTSSLNYDAGEIAYNLDSLYNYMIRRIIDAEYQGNLEAIEEVITYLQELRGSWEQIVRKSS